MARNIRMVGTSQGVRRLDSIMDTLSQSPCARGLLLLSILIAGCRGAESNSAAESSAATIHPSLGAPPAGAAVVGGATRSTAVSDTLAHRGGASTAIPASRVDAGRPKSPAPAGTAATAGGTAATSSGSAATASGSGSARQSAPPAPLAASYPGIRALYLNRFAAQSTKKMQHLLAIADRTEINAFVIDMKDEFGLNYLPENPEYRKLAGTSSVIRNVK